MPVPYPVFRAALDSGDLLRVLQLARDMPPMRLDDALRVCLLLRDGDPDRFSGSRARPPYGALLRPISLSLCQDLSLEKCKQSRTSSR